MLHHYITLYEENGKSYVESWLQLNIFKWNICFSKRKKEIPRLQLIVTKGEDKELVVDFIEKGDSIVKEPYDAKCYYIE